jgi:hypothetical protein
VIASFTAAAQRTAALMARLGDRFARDLASILRDTERQLGPLVRDAAEGSRTAIIKAARANRMRTDIREALRLAGYDELAESAAGSRLDALVQDVLARRRLAQRTAKLTAAFDQRLAALQALHGTDLLDEGDVLARELWQATTRGLFGSQPIDQILADLAGVIDGNQSQIVTLYDTAVAIFSRQVEALQAGDDPETPFLYLGPDDAKTRPFCRDHVGKVFTRDRIDEMDNGQLDTCFLTGGGYNCRHQWMEISVSSALYEYVNTDERVPEFLESAA